MDKVKDIDVLSHLDCDFDKVFKDFMEYEEKALDEAYKIDPSLDEIRIETLISIDSCKEEFKEFYRFLYIKSEGKE